jgi:hypothetical protein
MLQRLQVAHGVAADALVDDADPLLRVHGSQQGVDHHHVAAADGVAVAFPDGSSPPGVRDGVAAHHELAASGQLQPSTRSRRGRLGVRALGETGDRGRGAGDQAEGATSGDLHGASS